MSNKELKGKSAVVTGGASGIGRATALSLADSGAHVAVVDRDAVGGEETVRRIEGTGGAASFFAFDLFETDKVEALMTSIIGAIGRVDILINAAGIADHPRGLMETDAELWDTVLTVNLKSPFLLIQSAARHMIANGGGGRIVNVSSSSAFRGKYTWPAYSCSKAGINQLTRTAAGELGVHDINVNSVVPGVTRTAMVGDVNADFTDIVTNGPLANMLGRISEAEDVAALITFLCLPASRQITGQAIHVSAGAVI